ncbi:MAG: TatD family hydrolase [Chthoniobacterales bacterium]
MLIDTHAHLDFSDFKGEVAVILDRAAEAGVTRVITIGTGVESSRRAVALAEEFPQVYAVVGVHPGNVEEEPSNFLDPIRELLAHPKVAAIGETGLDYYRLPSAALTSSPAIAALGAEVPEDAQSAVVDGAYKAAQAEAFRQQLELAVEFGLNVVVHQRDAWDDTLELLRPYNGRLRAVFHCFGNQPEQAAEIAAMGHLVSFTGIATFKNAPLVHETAAAVASDGYMVETDCPYLAPVPHRGSRCEPAHTRLVAEKIAELRGTDLETVARESTATAESFFRFQ